MYENKIYNAGDFLRDGLDWASRDELYAYAKANNVKEIDEAMYMGGQAGMKMKKILRALGLTNIKTKVQLFERPGQVALPESSLDKLADETNTPLPPRVTETVDHKVMSRAELAKECKQRGIKMARTDTKEKLLERLSESHAA